MYEECKISDIAHSKVEKLFAEYIDNFNRLELENAEIKDNDTENKNQKILEYIDDCENKLKNQERRKKQVMEQFMSEGIGFDDYRKLMEISNAQYDALTKEIERAKSEMSVEEKPKISKDDIILDLKENWHRLDKKERAIFLQRFIKKIVLVSEKTEKRSLFSIKSIELL